MLRSQVTESAAEAEPDHTGGAVDASGRDEAEGLRRLVEIEPCRAAVGAGDPRLAIHFDPAHQREVDHQPVITDAVAGGIVPPSAHGQGQLVRPCEIESDRDIASAEATRDHRRPAIDERIEAAAYCVVLGVGGADDGASQRPSQLVQALV